ncbi:hypothetical protein HYR99_20835, partial [Candidatus Poribacteria bacterium]|nr:hypothetical protein [Candidatus Poribacteria bacterium]
NKMPDVNPVEIEAARTQLEALETTAQTLEREQQNLREQVGRENQRAQAHQKLIEAQGRQEELLNQQPEITRLQSELDNAHRAAGLRSERLIFQREGQNFKVAQNALADAQRALENAQNEHGESSTAFNDVDAQYQAMMVARAPKMEAYQKAVAEESRAKTQVEEAKRRKEELRQIESVIESLSKTVIAQQEEVSMLERQIEADGTYLNDHPLPADREHRLSQARAHLATLTEKWKTHREKSNAQKALDGKIRQVQCVLADLEKQREALLKKNSDADDALIVAETELKRWQALGNMEKWHEQKRKPQRMRPIAGEYEDAMRQRRETQRELEQKRAALNAVETALATVNQALDAQSKDLAHATEKVKRCQLAERDALIANQALSLRKAHLHTNQPCPVCGAIEHPWADKEEVEGEKQIERAQRELAHAEAELKIQQENRNHLQQQRARVEANQADLQRQSGELCERAETLDEGIELRITQWRESYPEAEISSKHIDDEIDAAEAHLQQFQAVMDAHTKAVNDQKFTRQSLTHQDEKIQVAQAEVADFETQFQTLTSALRHLSDEIEAVEAQFWESLPDTFRNGEPQESLERFEKQIHAVKACEKRLNDKQSLWNQLNVDMAGNIQQLEAEQRRKAAVETECGRYQAESERLLAAARAKTGGLRAAEALQKLEAERLAQTDQRQHAQEALRQKKEALIKAQTHSDRAESHDADSRETFEAAQRAYQTALKAAGFDSPEEHARAFRDDAWLKANQDTIERYRKEQHAIEQAIASYRAFFTEQPFTPQVMEHLQRAEKECAAQMRANTEKIGELRKTIQDMETHQCQREKQAVMLEKARKEKERWEHLQKEIGSNKLRDFALKRMFDQMIRLANRQLEELTHRYQLKVMDMKDMVVIDKWNANEERPIETLSGGESFLTSLSLALALSEMSKGRTQLNSLFLDEGFGTLDTQTLEIAISALEGLRLTGRSIIVISHVGELTRRIPVRIAVEKMGNGSSRVRVVER